MNDVFDYVKINKSTRHIFKILDQNGIDFGEIYLLSEILKRKSENSELPNIKWVQNELCISFTKLKSMMDGLENRGYIKKIGAKRDHRIKFIDITESGKEFFFEICQITHNAFSYLY